MKRSKIQDSSLGFLERNPVSNIDHLIQSGQRIRPKNVVTEDGSMVEDESESSSSESDSGKGFLILIRNRKKNFS